METTALSTVVEEYQPTAVIVAELNHVLANRVYDLRSVKGNDEARADRKKLVTLRTSLDKIRTELNRQDKATIEERIQLRNDEAKRLTAIVESLEGPIDAQIKADEKRREDERLAKEKLEADRKEKLQRMVSDIHEMALTVVGATSKDIEAQLQLVTELQIGEEYQELANDARNVRQVSITNLTRMLETVKAQEAEAVRVAAEREELARLRAADDARKAEEERVRAEEEAKRKAQQEEEDKGRRKALEESFAQKEQELLVRKAEQDRLDAEAEERRRVADAEITKRQAEVAAAEAHQKSLALKPVAESAIHPVIQLRTALNDMVALYAQAVLDHGLGVDAEEVPQVIAARAALERTK